LITVLSSTHIALPTLATSKGTSFFTTDTIV
jgi:hypothetical protein